MRFPGWLAAVTLASAAGTLCLGCAQGAAGPRASDAGGPDYLKVKDLTPVTALETPTHPPVVLARGGMPVAKVYVADASPSKALAVLVKELVEAVKLSTGAELQQVKEMPAADTPAIVIGDCAATRAAGIDAAKIPIEGFVVKTAANRVFLVGSTVPLAPGSNQWNFWSNEGTAWAVADFLERFVGVRWYWPTNAGGRSVVATRTLAVPPACYRDEPVFRKREFFPAQRYDLAAGERGRAAPPESALAPGVTGLDMTVLLAGLRAGNSYPYVIKVHCPQQIWKNQALVDAHKGLFMKRANGQINPSMLCYSSQETYDFLMAGCEAVWDKGTANLPAWNGHGVSWVAPACVTISPGDEPIDCYCEKCRALYDPQGGNRGTGSRIMGAFVKRFADEVKRRWPDKKVLYLPYWNYTVLPKGIEFPDNLEIQMCTMAFPMMRQPGWRGQMETCLRDWRRVAHGKIQTWEYPHRVIEYPGTQLQYPHLVQDYYRHNRDLLVGSFLNGGSARDWSKTAPTLYCHMKILWNPEVDVDAIWDAMCVRQFGQAAGTARLLLGLMADRWEKAPWSLEMDDMGYLEPAIYRETWPPDVVLKMTDLWTRACAQLKDDPAALRRFLYVTWGFETFAEEVKARSAAAAGPPKT